MIFGKGNKKIIKALSSKRRVFSWWKKPSFIILLILSLFFSYKTFLVKAAPPYTLLACGVSGDVTLSSTQTWDDNYYNQLSGIIKCNNITIPNGVTLTISPHSTNAAFNQLFLDGDIRVLNGGKLILNSKGVDTTGAGAGTPRGMQVIVNGDVRVESGGLITAGDQTANISGKGYNAQKGPGGSAGLTYGGTYGGVGGSSNKAVYGSMDNPIDLGSGGNNSSGGGLVYFSVNGSFVNKGRVSADGTTTTFEAGSGGSIRIEANSILGDNGIFSADGGNATYTSSNRQGGGGGRIALVYKNNFNFFGTKSAYGGNYNASPGTIFIAKTPVIGGPISNYIDKELFYVNKLVTTTSASNTIIPSGTYKNIFVNDIASGNFKIEVGTGQNVVIDGGYLRIKNIKGTNGFINRGNIISGPSGGDIFITNESKFYNIGNIQESGGDQRLNLSVNGLNSLFENRNNVEQKFNNVEIINKANITHTASAIVCNNTTCVNQPDGDNGTHYNQDYSLRISAKGDFVLDKNSTINVNIKGYNYVQGPGSYPAPTTVAGSYGGRGGGNSAPEYGSIDNPNDYGSAGYTGSEYYKAGGLFRMKADGNAYIQGSVTANGSNGSHAGASGGGIKIEANNIYGTGLITANGGDYGTSGNNQGGGGGRVALIYKNSNSFFGEIKSLGGLGYSNAGGSPGSIFFAKTPSIGETDTSLYTNRELIIKGNQVASNNYKIPSGDYTFVSVKALSANKVKAEIPTGQTVEMIDSVFLLEGNVEFQNYGTIESANNTAVIAVKDGAKFYNEAGGYINIPNGHTIIDGTGSTFESRNNIIQKMGNLSLQNGALMTHKASQISCRESQCIRQDWGDGNDLHYDQDYALRLETKNVLIDQNSSIDVSQKGYPNGTGPAGGLINPSGQSTRGASYGGKGGGTSLPAYGDYYNPNDYGSCGYQGSSGPSAGGLVRINVNDNIIINGNVLANSVSSISGSAGGGVKIEANSISGNGNIRANGGNRTNTSYNDGGGGRVALVYNEKSFNGNISVNRGGTIGTPENGTIYEEDTDDTISDFVGPSASALVYPMASMPNTGMGYFTVDPIAINDHWFDEGQGGTSHQIMLNIISDGSFPVDEEVRIYLSNDVDGEYEFSSCSGSNCTANTTYVSIPASEFSLGSASVNVSIRDKRTGGEKHRSFTSFYIKTNSTNYSNDIDGQSNYIEMEDGVPERPISDGGTVTKSVFANSTNASAALSISSFATQGTQQYQQDLGGVIVLRRTGNEATYGTLNLQRRIYTVGEIVNTNYTVICANNLGYGETVQCLDNGPLALNTDYTYGVYTFDNTFNFFVSNEVANYSPQTLFKVNSSDPGAGKPSNVYNFEANSSISANQINLSWNNPAENLGHIKTIIIKKALANLNTIGSSTNHPVDGTDYFVGDYIGDGEVVYASTNIGSSNQLMTWNDTDVVDGFYYIYEIYTQFVGNRYPSHLDTADIRNPGTDNSSEQTFGVILNNKPTHDNPIIDAESQDDGNHDLLAGDDEDLLAEAKNLADLDSDPIKEIYNWKVGNATTRNPITVLNMPFEANIDQNLVKDYSGYGNNGNFSIVRPTWGDNSGFDGGGAFYFNGVINNHIGISDSASLHGGLDMTSLTLEAWIKPGENLSSNKRIISKWTGSKNSYLLGYHNTLGLYFQIREGNGTTPFVNKTYSFIANNWYHIVAVYGDDNMNLYINGTLASNLPLSPTTRTDEFIGGSDTEIYIGAGLNNTNYVEYFKGYIDDVKIYKTALTPEQIASNYNAGTGNYKTIVSEQTALGQVWEACMTPNDGKEDGDTKCSDTTTISLIDNTDPVIGPRTNTPSSKSSNTMVKVAFTVTDDTAISASNISVSGVAFNSFSCTPAGPTTSINCTLNVTSSGTLQISATDDGGNNATDSESGYFIDNTAPLATFSSDCIKTSGFGGDWCTNNPVNVTISGNDFGGSGVTDIHYKIGAGGSWNDIGGSSTTFAVSTEGLNEIYYYIEDAVGNTDGTLASPKLGVIKIDSIEPSIPTITPASGFRNDGTSSAKLTISWGGTSSDGVTPPASGLLFYVICEDINGAGYNCSGNTTATSILRESLLDGFTYKYKVLAIDSAGNRSDYSPEVTYTIDRTGPDAPSISCNVPNPLRAPWTNGGSTISWGLVPDNTGGIGVIDNYYLYRTSGGCNSGSCPLPADPASGLPPYAAPYQTLNSPNNSYSEIGLSNETIYRYKVNADDTLSNQGNSSPVSCEVKVDTQKPVTTVATQIPASANGDGWYNTDVMFQLSVSDNLSGLDLDFPKYSLNGAAYAGPALNFTISNESDSNTLSIRSQDNAGNLEDPVNLYTGGSPLKIDKTDPIGNNHVVLINGLDFEIDIDGIDSTSGIKTISSNIYDVTSGSPVEEAGSPVSLTNSSGDNKNGHWDGVFTFGAAPTGIYSVKTTITDYAGNETVIWSSPVDNMPPVINITAPTHRSKGDINDTTFTVTDVGGGIDPANIFVTDSTVGTVFNNAVNCTVVSPTEVSCTVSITSTPDESVWGNNKFTVRAIDDSGNTNIATEAGYLIDRDNPTVSISFSPAFPNGNNPWYTTNVDFTINATDFGGAGIKKIYYKKVENGVIPGSYTEVPGSTATGTLTAEGDSYVIFYAEDNTELSIIGNLSVPNPDNSSIIHIDKTNPGIPTFITGGMTTKLGTSVGTPLSISWNDATDPGSYASGRMGYNVYRDDGTGYVLYKTNISLTTISEDSLVDGSYKYKLKTLDNAGRESDFSSEITINIDTTGPLPTDVSCNSPSINTTTNNLSWLTATDVGLSGTVVRHDIYRTPAFIPTDPIEVDMPTLSLLDPGPLVDGGSYTYIARGFDDLLNIGAPSDNPCTTRVDLQKPVTTHSIISGTLGAGGWYRGTVGIKIDSTDPGSNPTGVAFKQYKLSGATTLPYTNYGSSFDISNEGTTNLYYKSSDLTFLSSNEEDEKGSFAINIDNTLPALSDASVNFNSSTSNLLVTLESPEDALSGIYSMSAEVKDGATTIATIPSFNIIGSGPDYSATVNLPGLPLGTYNVIISIIDNAGNTFIRNSDSFAHNGTVVANTPPVISSTSASQVLNTDYVKIEFDLKDPDYTAPGSADVSFLYTNDGTNSVCSISNVSLTQGGASIALPYTLTNVTDSNQKYTFYWDAGTDCPGNTYKILDGNYVKVSVDDLSGGTDDDISAAFLLDTEDPSTAPDDLVEDSHDDTSVSLNAGTTLADDEYMIAFYRICYDDVIDGNINHLTADCIADIDAGDYNISDTVNYAGPFTATGLNDDTEYEFNVWAYDRYGHYLSAANEIVVKTEKTPAPPGPGFTPNVLILTSEGTTDGLEFDGEKTTAGSTINSINFGDLDWLETGFAALKITGETDNSSGYNIKISQNKDLTNSMGDTIKGFDANLATGLVPNSAPLPWISPVGNGYFGYSTTCNTLNGVSDRFTNPRSWAALTTSPEEVVRYGSAGKFEDYLLFKLELGKGQKAGTYRNKVIIEITNNIP
uniref:Fibronectin type-III domain-containing protein n=1 Tax=candidate division CPR3 bacterium TaxID=2268181 RepID=A0A7C4M0I6_UNCC3